MGSLRRYPSKNDVLVLAAYRNPYTGGYNMHRFLYSSMRVAKEEAERMIREGYEPVLVVKPIYQYGYK